MTNFEKYINKIENQDFKEFTKYLDEGELNKLEFHFDIYAKQLSIPVVVNQRELLVAFIEWFKGYCDLDLTPNEEDIDLFLSN